MLGNLIIIISIMIASISNMLNDGYKKFYFIQCYICYLIDSVKSLKKNLFNAKLNRKQLQKFHFCF